MLGVFSDYNEGDLIFIGDWSPTALIFLASIALIVLVLTYFDLIGLARSRRWVLLGLRASALGLALLLLLEPALELRHVQTTPNQAAFLFDSSASMGLPLAGGRETPRDRAQAQLESFSRWIADPPADHTPRLYTFDTDLTPLQGLELPAQPLGEGTHILESLEALVRDRDRRDIGGVIVVSDGADNGILGHRTPAGEPLDLDLVERLQRLGFPVHTIATSEVDELRDISISAVRHADFAFVRTALEIEVDVEIHGRFEGQIPATLYRNGEPVQTRHFVGDQPGQTVTLKFNFTPETIGRELYAISVPVQPGEASADNNQAFFLLRVVRDKIRVMHVAGRPSWDERYLRQLLRGNPNIDLVAFYILRTENSVQRVPQSELALIQFPTDELFRTELASFDLAVFHNFTHVPYGMHGYLRGIARYVRDGGALVMIGGEQSFSSGGYAGTPIEEILPVRLAAPTSQSAVVTSEQFRPSLTAAGARHPITRLAEASDLNREIWESMPLSEGANRVLGAQPWATTLATHPTIMSGDEPMPVIAVGEVGEGRSMAVTIDSTWRWTFDNIARGGSGRAYSSFWNSAVRWLIRDPELNLVQIELPQEQLSPNSRFEATLRFHESDYSPATNALVRLTLVRRPLDVERMMERELVTNRELYLDASGTHVWTGTLDEPGIYELHASRVGETSSQHSAREILLVQPPLEELRELRPRPELLEAISEATSGSFHQLKPPLNQPPRLLPARVVEVDRRAVIDLWNHPLILLLLLGMLSSEWFLRRRWGRL